jgi:hypothetical protein
MFILQASHPSSVYHTVKKISTTFLSVRIMQPEEHLCSGLILLFGSLKSENYKKSPNMGSITPCSSIFSCGYLILSVLLLAALEVAKLPLPLATRVAVYFPFVSLLRCLAVKVWLVLPFLIFTLKACLLPRLIISV